MTLGSLKRWTTTLQFYTVNEQIKTLVKLGVLDVARSGLTDVSDHDALVLLELLSVLGSVKTKVVNNLEVDRSVDRLQDFNH